MNGGLIGMHDSVRATLQPILMAGFERPLPLRWSQPTVGKSKLFQTGWTMNKMGVALADLYHPHATY